METRYHRRLLVADLQLDASLLKKSTWPTAVGRCTVEFMAPCGTPTKKSPAGSARGRGRHLFKSGGRLAPSPAEGEEDSDEASVRAAAPATPLPIFRAKTAQARCLLQKRRNPLAPSDGESEGDSDDATGLPSPRHSPRVRGKSRPGASLESQR